MSKSYCNRTRLDVGVNFNRGEKTRYPFKTFCLVNKFCTFIMVEITEETTTVSITSIINIHSITYTKFDI